MPEWNWYLILAQGVIRQIFLLHAYTRYFDNQLEPLASQSQQLIACTDASNPNAGCIQVSEVTHELLSHCHTFKAKGGLEIKGKVRNSHQHSRRVCCLQGVTFLFTPTTWYPTFVVYRV